MVADDRSLLDDVEGLVRRAEAEERREVAVTGSNSDELKLKTRLDDGEG